ncbi:hypothetical protein OZ411_01255 [Bradyrhizobium sp. Arg237L]|uniref:phage major capsid protein n=1 Tax=Bradyrhizobium sp. Arg237L TaxID=3003352 RepID=UPI00249F9279|nr:hypothetical protein [Bradyrhizobium sp. Arg237L]MDI4231440.1 hypothetical protein [Bradyrhizobium sp. Arg237L]
MKIHKWAAPALVLAVVAIVAYLFSDAAHAAVVFADQHTLVMANAALLALRNQHAELVQRAEAKIAEIKDGMPAADVTRIEGEHADLVRQASGVQVQIAAEEARSAAPPAPAAHAWSAADIGRVNARALAFGLTAADSVTVIGDTAVRSVEQATDRLQDLAAQRAPGRQNPHVRITQDEGDTIRTAIEASVLLRANPQAIPANAPEREMARNYRGMSLLESGRHFIEETQGVRLRGLSRLELAGVLLGLGTRGGMHSTSDFANLLANVASKRLRAAYAAAPQTFKAFCRQSNNPDFKAKSVVQLSAAPAFKKVREGQEYSYGGLTDGVEQYALSTFGRIVAITRQSLINDDLSAFDRIPTMVGRAAADLESSTVYDIILNNPNMGDGKALFSDEHGNLMDASPIDETNLGLADKAIRDQRGFAKKGEDREYLNLMPRFILTGTAKRVEAQKMVTAVTPSASSDVNVFQNALDPITEARIPGNKWLLVADPATVDTIEYSYLEGEEGVFIEQHQGFEVDGIQIKGRLDFAAKAIDWRGFAYNPGNGG